MNRQIATTMLLISLVFGTANADPDAEDVGKNNLLYDDSMLSYFPFTFFFVIVPEGAVGIFKRGGFWQESYDPGLYGNLPITTLLPMKTRPQVDVLKDIRCGTRDGLTISFEKVTIYNVLPKASALDIVSRFGENYDDYLVSKPAIQAMTELCSEMSAQELYIDKFSAINDILTRKLQEEQIRQNSQLLITQVTVTKPVLPENIHKNYQTIVEEKTRIIAVEEEHKRKTKQEETQQTLKRQEAENQKRLSMMKYDQKLSEASKQAELDKINIDNESYKKKKAAETDYFTKQKAAKAEAEKRKLQGEAEAESTRVIGIAQAESIEALGGANKKLLTENYVKLKYAKAFQNAKHLKLIFFGEKIPSSMVSFFDFKAIKKALFPEGDEQGEEDEEGEQVKQVKQVEEYEYEDEY